MDRSFLSNAQVVEASRDFVCIRLATYEDAEEAKFLEQIYTRGGDLENTVFAMLTPNAKRHLVRAGRGPSFRSAQQMAQRMKQIVSQDYEKSSDQRGADRTLPEMKSVDLAINVASCDGLPVVLAIGKDDAELAAMRKRLVPVAWSDKFAGQFVFATAKTDVDLRLIGGINEKKPEGIYILEPGRYGMMSSVLAQLEEVGPESKQIASVLNEFKPHAKQHREHVQEGYQLGLRWETAIPVTDKQAVQAASRLWGRD